MQIAGASLSGLDSHGAQIAWVDTRGAQLTAIRFDPPAHGPTTLVCRLREQLIRSDRSDANGAD